MLLLQNVWSNYVNHPTSGAVVIHETAHKLAKVARAAAYEGGASADPKAQARSLLQPGETAKEVRPSLAGASAAFCRAGL